MLALKNEIKEIIQGQKEVILVDIASAVGISEQKAGAILRKLNWRNDNPYARDRSIFRPEGEK